VTVGVQRQLDLAVAQRLHHDTINKAGRVWGDGMTAKALWDVVRAAAARAGIEKLASSRPPADVRTPLPSRWW